MDLWDFYLFSRSHRDDLVGQTIQNHKKTPTFTQWIGLLGKIYTGNHRFPHQITWGLNRFQFSKTNPLTYHMFFGKNGHPPAVIWGYQNLGPWIWEKIVSHDWLPCCHWLVYWVPSWKDTKNLSASLWFHDADFYLTFSFHHIFRRKTRGFFSAHHGPVPKAAWSTPFLATTRPTWGIPRLERWNFTLW